MWSYVGQHLNSNETNMLHWAHVNPVQKDIGSNYTIEIVTFKAFKCMNESAFYALEHLQFTEK